MSKISQQERFARQAEIEELQKRVRQEEAQVEIHTLADYQSVENRSSLTKSRDVWVDTGILSADKIRHLYVNVRGCRLQEVRQFLTVINEGKVNRKTLSLYLPVSSGDKDITDVFPLQAVPRVGLQARRPKSIR